MTEEVVAYQTLSNDNEAGPYCKSERKEKSENEIWRVWGRDDSQLSRCSSVPLLLGVKRADR